MVNMADGSKDIQVQVIFTIVPSSGNYARELLVLGAIKNRTSDSPKL